MQTIPILFDRQLVQRRRDRAAAGFDRHDFLVREACERLAERLTEINRAFPLALDLGCHTGQFAETMDVHGKIERLVQCDLSEAMLRRSTGARIAVDEEFLPFAENTFDLVVSALSLHWVNDLPGALIQIRRILKPDGLFLATLPGAETLRELRESFTHASLEQSGGASPRLSPFLEVRDAGALLQRAGFALPVADSDALTVSYPNALSLMQELRGMGESNALGERSRLPLSRSLLAATAAYYQNRFSNGEGRIDATFEFVTLTGWSPHASQQQPAKRGSGTVSLASALNKPS